MLYQNTHVVHGTVNRSVIYNNVHYDYSKAVYNDDVEVIIVCSTMYIYQFKPVL